MQWRPSLSVLLLSLSLILNILSLSLSTVLYQRLGIGDQTLYHLIKSYDIIKLTLGLSTKMKFYSNINNLVNMAWIELGDIIDCPAELQSIEIQEQFCGESGKS